MIVCFCVGPWPCDCYVSLFFGAAFQCELLTVAVGFGVHMAHLRSVSSPSLLSSALVSVAEAYREHRLGSGTLTPPRSPCPIQ